MRLRLVASPTQNAFMTELLEALARELRDQGMDAELAGGFAEAEPDLAYATIPHEFFETTDAAAHPTREQLARTVAICTEQPGTVWSTKAIGHAAGCGAVMDISEVGLTELRRCGLRGEHLALGYHAEWDAWGGDSAKARPLDILFMGTKNRRREVHLSSYADVLAHREVDLVLPLPGPKTAPTASFLLGGAKHALLTSASVLINVRAQIPPYFEWLRAIEAISNGAVLVCEHGAGHAPLIPGQHFVGGAPENLGHLAEALLGDPGRADAIRMAAYGFLRDELPMSAGARRLGEVAESLCGVAAR